MKFAIYTLGCKVNQYDSQMMKDILITNGHEAVAFNQTADCYIVNTCTVTNTSDKKSRQIISRCKQKNPDAVIIVCGCFSQISPQAVGQIPDVDIVLGTANRKKIHVYLQEFLEHRRPIIAPADLSKEKQLSDESVTEFSDKTRAILKIEDGCQNFCSYCVIPFARGKIRSKPPEQVISEVTTLLNRDFKEIVLTGIHLASYGRDLENTDLADIIQKIVKIPIPRIRLGSLEPGIITDDFLDKIKTIPSLMPSFHLSLQSGSDTVLKRMNRHYTTEDYAAAVEKLRSAFPGCAVTTDIIVGFPGETEEEFAQTLHFAEMISFAKIHIFPYSMRDGTKAAAMPDQIAPSVKSERCKRLEAVELHCRLRFLKSQIGSVQPVLFEQKKEQYWQGHTPNYQPVLVESKENLAGCIEPVCITRTDGQVLWGKMR